MKIIVLLWLWCQAIHVDGQINVYSFEGYSITHTDDRDCLYAYTDQYLSIILPLIPYCLRSESNSEIRTDEQRCYGEMLTFQQLRSSNVTVADLFHWNAAIRVIDHYAEYLSVSTTLQHQNTYCKCSSILQFGEYCQYQFHFSHTWNDPQVNFNMLISNRDDSIQDTLQSTTCYIGIPCQNSLSCLDWRQICNGVVDCDHAEDEPTDLCIELEKHQCDPHTEFRCKNGMCIPMGVSNDQDYDCLDRTDSIAYHYNPHSPPPFKCVTSDVSQCEELNCGWQQYSCGDGQCISYADIASVNNQPGTGTACPNRQNIVLLRQLFASQDMNPCWIAMICLTGFSHLYSNVICSNSTILSNIETYCPDEYYFPPNPVVYSFVFLLYMKKIDRTTWRHDPRPDFICFSHDSCPQLLGTMSVLQKGSLTCMPVNATRFSWMHFYDDILRLFRPCFSSVMDSSSINDRNLYRCNHTYTWISIHRLNDGIKDCPFGEDEDPAADQSLLKIQNSKRIITQDTYMPEFYPFEQLCDGIVDPRLQSDHPHETDETDCDDWPYNCYNAPYNRCNQVWNCKNGIDELSCQVKVLKPALEDTFGCKKDEHYCIQFINNGLDINRTCLHINRTGDGIIDCVGGTDERLSSICIEKYPFEDRRRFQCMNSTVCITPEQVCDRLVHCPFEDDERVCPWLYRSNATQFHCQGSTSTSIARCYTSVTWSDQCKFTENYWFCDLAFSRQTIRILLETRFDLYPQISSKMQSLVPQSIDSWTTTSRKKSLTLESKPWLCHRGYPLHSIAIPGRTLCLCPPSYFGLYCQFQAERLTVLLKLQRSYHLSPFTVFRLFLILLDDQHNIISYDELLYHPESTLVNRFLIYLLYERRTNTSLHERNQPRWLRIDAYIIKETSVQYINSWFFSIAFPFLPVNRISTTLNLVDDFYEFVSCHKKCGAHGKCMYYLNLKKIEHCWCDQGWYGDRCHLQYSSDLCHHTSCAPHSRCLVLDAHQKLIKCLCALGRSGDRCYITHHPCRLSPCQNNGTCLPLDQRNLGYVCICSTDYDGELCQNRRRKMFISINNDRSISHSPRIPAALVIMANPAKEILSQRRILFSQITLPTTLKVYGPLNFGLMQIFHNWSHHSYYMIAIQDRPLVLFNTSLLPINRCQNITTLFNRTILYHYSYLKRLKLYHLPCRTNHQLRCFFDQYRMCFCTRHHNSICYRFDQDQNHCNYCKNDGLCVQRGPLEEQWQYICLCSPCSFGTLCQFSMNTYFVTFDTLIGTEIKTAHPSLSQQPLVILITLITLIIIFIVGSISNLISFLILMDKKLQRVSCDVYLLHLTIVSELGLITLVARFLYMLLIQIYDIKNIRLIQLICLFLEYLVRLIPALFDWFIVCIAMERTYIVIRHVHFTKMNALKSLKLARWIVMVIYLANVLTTLHRPFHLTLIAEPTIYSQRLRHPWCILQFHSKSWNVYEKFINSFHLVTPLVLNIISIVTFLFTKIKFQLAAKTANYRLTLLAVLTKQLTKYKSILISTIIVIILEIPRCLLTFLYSCIRDRWHRYIFLSIYLISFLPLTGIFTIYILPSPKYRQQLRKLLPKLF